MCYDEGDIGKMGEVMEVLPVGWTLGVLVLYWGVTEEGWRQLAGIVGGRQGRLGKVWVGDDSINTGKEEDLHTLWEATDIMWEWKTKSGGYNSVQKTDEEDGFRKLGTEEDITEDITNDITEDVGRNKCFCM